MVRFLRNLALAAFLAILCLLCGCNSFPAGGKLAVGFTLDPVGVSVSYQAGAAIVVSPAGQWVLVPPATAPATAPGTPPGTPSAPAP